MKLFDYINKSKTLDSTKFEKEIRVSILSSFTVNGLAEVIKVKCAELDIGCKTYISGYNQFSQEILNSKGELYKFKSDIIFNYDIDLLDETYIDICLSGLNLVNSDKEASANKIDLKNKEKGLFEKFFNLFG